MEKKESIIKKLGAMKVVVTLIAVAMLFACFGFMFYSLVFRQHNSENDSEFFSLIWSIKDQLSEGMSGRALIADSNYSIWAVIIAFASVKTGIHPLELCHRIGPAVLMVVLLMLYLYLGYRLFVLERKGRYYAVIGAVLFTACFFFFQYFLRYLTPSVHLSLYVNPWREQVIALFVCIPMILATVLRVIYTSKDRKIFSWIRDIIILGVEIIILFVVYASQFIYQEFKVDGHGLSYILKCLWETSWGFFMAVAFIVVCILLKMKSIIPLVGVAILGVVVGIPIPLALIISYGITALVVNIESISIWQPLAYVIVGLFVYVLSIVTGSSVNFVTSFGPVKNKYRINKDVPSIVDYVTTDADEVTVVSDSEMGSAISQYSEIVNTVILDDVTTDNSTFVFDVGLKEADYVIIKSDVEPSEALLINDEYAYDSKVGDYTVYRRSYWEKIGDAWAHKGPYGFYLKDGWYKIDNELYYMNADGEVQTGWFEYNGEFYYLKEDGKMAMNWEEIEDKWYFFGTDGAMRHDVTEAGFTLGSDGAMVED